ncbi:MAG: hypothetical protein ACREV7_18600 [Steroidobacteraceae bacterium]
MPRLAVVSLGGLAWSAVRSMNLIPALYVHWRRRQLMRSSLHDVSHNAHL